MAKQQSIERIKEVKEKYKEQLMKKANVQSVGVGYVHKGGKMTEEVGIVVNVEEKFGIQTLNSNDVLPKSIDGIRVDVLKTGKLQIIPPKAAKQDVGVQGYQGKVRPLQGGYSVGNKNITAGTILGFGIRDTKRVAISNAHVFCSDPRGNVSDQVSKDILQPGKYDGGTEKVATLVSFVQLNPEKANYCDTAVAELDDQTNYTLTMPEIGGYKSKDMSEAVLGEKLCKVGRTTGYTEGTVTQINVSANVSYGDFSCKFNELTATTAMSAGGDSGSGIALKDTKALKYQMFAGSSTVTLMFSIARIETALRTEILVGNEGPTQPEVTVDFTLESENPSGDLYTVKGVVKQQNGNPIGGATVKIDDTETTTDQYGNYSFKDVEEGTYNMTASKTGYKTASKEVTI